MNTEPLITRPEVLESNDLYVSASGSLEGLQISTVDIYGNVIHLIHVVKDGSTKR